MSYNDLADILTGYNCDSYADATEELICEADGNIQAAIEYDEETYNRVRAYHRILNGALSDEDCEDAWLDSLSGYDA